MENFWLQPSSKKEKHQTYYSTTPIIKTYYRFRTKVQDGKWRTIHAMRRTPWLSILVACKRQESVPCRHPSAAVEPKTVISMFPWKEHAKKFLGDLYQKTTSFLVIHIAQQNAAAPVNKRWLWLEPPSLDQLLKRWFVFLVGLMPNKTNTARQRKLT